MAMVYCAACTAAVSGRIVAKLAVAKQRRRHILHPHQRSRSVDDRRIHRVFHKVADGRATTTGTTGASKKNPDIPRYTNNKILYGPTD